MNKDVRDNSIAYQFSHLRGKLYEENDAVEPTPIRLLQFDRQIFHLREGSSEQVKYI